METYVLRRFKPSKSDLAMNDDITQLLKENGYTDNEARRIKSEQFQ